MLTIGITTFKYRFEKYFKPLLEKIKNIDNDIEVIVLINGEHNETFDEKYRSNILKFLSDKKNTYPIMFTEFRSLSKLWNNIVINSTNENILILNDDISITSDNFIIDLKNKTNCNLNVRYNQNYQIIHEHETLVPITVHRREVL